MSKFVVIAATSAYSWWDRKKIDKIQETMFYIETAPAMYNYEQWVYSKKEEVSFDEVLKIFYRSFSKNDYLGVMSLIYWKYYNEFYGFLVTISKDQNLLKKYKRATMKFYRKALKKWIIFIKYSDDTMYPQNHVFREMDALIKNTYFKN